MAHARQEYKMSERCAVACVGSASRSRSQDRGSRWIVHAVRPTYANHVWSFKDEFLNDEIFYPLKEMRVLTERWRVRTLRSVTSRLHQRSG